MEGIFSWKRDSKEAKITMAMVGQSIFTMTKVHVNAKGFLCAGVAILCTNTPNCTHHSNFTILPIAFGNKNLLCKTYVLHSKNEISINVIKWNTATQFHRYKKFFNVPKIRSDTLSVVSNHEVFNMLLLK